MPEYKPPTETLPAGYDLEAEEHAHDDVIQGMMDAMPSFTEFYRKAEAAGFKRGFEAARAQLLRAVAEAPISAEPPVLRIEGPKTAPAPAEPRQAAPEPVAAPKAPEPAPPPPPATPAPPPAAPAPRMPAMPGLPVWSPERDEIVSDGWVCHVPVEHIAAAVNHLPGPLIHASDVEPRARVIRCKRVEEYASGCENIYDLAIEAGWNWDDSIGAVYDFIAREDGKKREAARLAKLEAAPQPPPPPPAKAPAETSYLYRVSQERQALLAKEYPAGIAIRGILRRYNAMEGEKTDEAGLRQIANKLNLRRPRGFDWKLAPEELPTVPQPASAAPLPNGAPEPPLEVDTAPPVPPPAPPPVAAPPPPPPSPAPPAPLPPAAPPPPAPASRAPAAPAKVEEVKLPAPGPDGKIRAPLLDLIRWSKSVGFQGFDGSNVEALNRWCLATMRPSVVVQW